MVLQVQVVINCVCEYIMWEDVKGLAGRVLANSRDRSLVFYATDTYQGRRALLKETFFFYLTFWMFIMPKLTSQLCWFKLRRTKGWPLKKYIYSHCLTEESKHCFTCTGEPFNTNILCC